MLWEKANDANPYIEAVFPDFKYSPIFFWLLKVQNSYQVAVYKKMMWLLDVFISTGCSLCLAPYLQ